MKTKKNKLKNLTLQDLLEEIELIDGNYILNSNMLEVGLWKVRESGKIKDLTRGWDKK